MIFTDEDCERVEFETWMYLMKVYLSEPLKLTPDMIWGRKMVLDLEDEMEIRKYIHATLELAITNIENEDDLDNPLERGIIINTPNKKYKLQLLLEEVK